MNSRTTSSRKSKKAFTLVEIMVVVAIIGLLAALAYPAFQVSRNNARAARFINDLRNAVNAFEMHALQTGYYPDDAAPAVVPAGMEDELKRPQWDKPTPLGGQWAWRVDESDFYAGVIIVGATVELDVVQRIDARIDDGDLGAGYFQAAGGNYVYIIE